jgi:hypothetical protein
MLRVLSRITISVQAEPTDLPSMRRLLCLVRDEAQQSGKTPFPTSSASWP